MHTRFLTYSGLAIVSLLTALSSGARAQWWLEDRRRAEGHGLRAGNLELHPGIGAEIGYDSNVFYEESNPQGSAILRLSPHFLLSTLGEERSIAEGGTRKPPAVRFRGGLSGGYYHYFATSNKDDLSATVDLHLEINPDRPFTLLLDGGYTRSVTPFVEPGGVNPRFDRDRVNVGPKLVFASKSGLLKAGIGYNFGGDFFEDKSFNFNNSVTHNIGLDASWQFIPKTALIYDGTLSIQNFTKADPNSPVMLNDNKRLKSRLGVNGALTSKVSFTALAGYAAGFFDAQEDYDGAIGQVELRWKPSETFTWKIAGWERSYDSAFEGNYCRMDRFYTGADLMVGGVFLLNADIWAGLLRYGVPRTGNGAWLGSEGDKNRNDTRISAALGGEYRFVDWLAADAKVSYLTDITDFKTVLANIPGAPPTLSPEPEKFGKFEGWLGLRAFY